MTYLRATEIYGKQSQKRRMPCEKALSLMMAAHQTV